MTKPRNVIVAQSGGPSPVINSSLRGVVETCKAMPHVFGTVYAGFHGIEGVLKEELLDLSAQPDEEIALLGVTPAAGSIGTCRYKLKDKQKEDFARVIEVFRAHSIGYFFRYARPLIGDDWPSIPLMDGRQRFARLKPIFACQVLPASVPQALR